MTKSKTLETLIPYPAPDGRVARTLLLAIRRLATGGVSDAQAASIFIGTFGLGYRRPLMFLRVLIGEVSRIAQQPIIIAPCCCRRMSEGEAALLTIIISAREDPARARATLARTTGSLDGLAALSVAQALADTLDDIGHPVIVAQNWDCLA